VDTSHIASFSPVDISLMAYSEYHMPRRLTSVSFPFRAKSVGMANAGAVSKALNRLESHDLVYEVDGEYRFGDSFFRQWILKNG
jgi:hypothetical protein